MVVLDLIIVVVALPHIQAALGFSGSNLEWVVNAYAVAFGGLLLLGGRAGDLQGRRRILIAGLLVFSLASLLGMFFFLTLFVQDVWGYSALRTAAAYLPFVPAVLATTALAQQAVSRVGARPLLIAGSAIAAGGMFWLSRLTEHSTFAGGMLGPELLLGAGLGLLFVPIPLVGLTKVNTGDTGVASSLVNVGQQVGGAIGLAIVGTVAWSAFASHLQSAAAAAAHAGAHPSAAQAAALQTHIYHHALAAGFSRGYLVSAGMLALIIVIALLVMRVSRADLSGADPAPEPTGDATSPSLV